MIEISYRAELGPVLRLLGGLSRRATNLRPVLEGPVARIMREMSRQNMVSGGSLATPSWPPLSARAAARPRIGPLRVSDRLFRGVSLAGGENIAEVSPSGNTLAFGTSVPYGIFHQEARGVPKRQPVPDPAPRSVHLRIRAAMAAYVLFGRTGGGGREA